MGRILVVITVGVTFVIALFTFFNRPQQSLRESINEDNDQNPRIILENFIVYRYQDSQIAETLTGKRGYYREPNIVEVSGRVEAEQFSDRTFDRAQCEVARAVFYGDSLNDIFTSPRLNVAELDKNVFIRTNQYLVSTDYAEYRAKTGDLSSDVPVTIINPRQTMRGDQGFMYNFDKERLVMHGQVEGVVQIDQFKTN